MNESSAETVAGKGRSAPKGRPTPKAKDHHTAMYQANYRAKRQWYVFGAVLVTAVIVALILVSIYSVGSTYFTNN